MKNANEFSINCTNFRENIRAFIDDELPVNEQSVFLKHTSECTACKNELRMMQYVKKALANLKHVSVSPEFDFRMKSSIRREYDRLRNPLYQFKIFVYENMPKLVTVSAAAILIIAGVILYSTHNSKQMTPVLPVEVITQIDAQKGVELGSDEENAVVNEVRYVLETVKPLDIEHEIIISEPDYIVYTASKNKNLTLVSF